MAWRSAGTGPYWVVRIVICTYLEAIRLYAFDGLFARSLCLCLVFMVVTLPGEEHRVTLPGKEHTIISMCVEI